jgi:hypothetical protein
MDLKEEALNFLLKARSQTYATGGNKVDSGLKGAVQYEYSEGDFSYTDVYQIGNGIFMGLDTVYYQGKPVISNSYFGNFIKVTEEEVDNILRAALSDNWETTRIWNKVEWDKENYHYTCDGEGDIDEFSGTEKILKEGEQVYYFYYAAGWIG